MKIPGTMTTLLAVGGLIGLSVIGCGRQQEEAPSSYGEVTSSVPSSAPAAPKPAIPPVMTDTQQAPADAVAPAANQAQTLIDKIKTLIAEKKYTEAVAELKNVSSMSLTPEQQKLVDDLKAQAQKAMTDAAAEEAKTKATGALGGALGK